MIPDDGCQGGSGLLSATPLLAVLVSASLVGFQRIDPMKANALTSDLDGVAVYDAGLAEHIFRGFPYRDLFENLGLPNFIPMSAYGY